MTKRIGKSSKTTWTCLVDVPADPVTGKCRQKRLSAPTKKELESLATKTLHELHTGACIEPSTTTTGAFLTQWLDTIQATVQPATIARYAAIIRGPIAPALGSAPLSKLTPMQLQDFCTRELAPTTVSLYHMMLHRALDQAVKWSLLLYNPCDCVDAPRRLHPTMPTWSTTQARAFLAGTAEHHLAVLWRLALLTGMRRGELLALRWPDVDLDKGELAVRHSLTRDRDNR